MLPKHGAGCSPGGERLSDQSQPQGQDQQFFAPPYRSLCQSRTIRDWNDLPQKVIDTKTIKGLKTHIIGNFHFFFPVLGPISPTSLPQYTVTNMTMVVISQNEEEKEEEQEEGVVTEKVTQLICSDKQEEEEELICLARNGLTHGYTTDLPTIYPTI